MTPKGTVLADVFDRPDAAQRFMETNNIPVERIKAVVLIWETE